MTLTESIQQEIGNIDLRTRGMLATLHLSCFEARKYDRTASREVAAANNASSDAGRYNKRLIDTDVYIKPIKKLQGEIRTYHYEHTLPFNEGARILNINIFDEYVSQMNQYEDEVRRKVDEFLAVYPLAKEGAKAMLGDMYNETDYPPIEEVKKKFGMEFYMQPLPDVQDFRITLTPGMIDRTAQKIESAYQDAIKESWNRLHDVIASMADKLQTNDDGTPKVFRDSLIGNLEDVVKVMPALNITGDPRLTAITERAQRKLTKYAPEVLREQPSLKKEVAAEASDILAKIRALRNA